MKKIIAITNQKGGVGKTTTTLNLGEALSNKGHKVLIIDLDPQGDMSKVASGGESRFDRSIKELFEKKNETNINDLISPIDGFDNFYFIPADIRLSRVIERGLTLSFREVRLTNHLKKIEIDFDYIILDCPPNLSLTTINAIVAADIYLAPINSGVFALDGLEDLLEALDETNQNSSLEFYAFRTDVAVQNTIINSAVSEDLLNIVGERVLKSKIRRSEHIGQALFMHKTIAKYKKSSLVINDYKSLANEILDL